MAPSSIFVHGVNSSMIIECSNIESIVAKKAYPWYSIYYTITNIKPVNGVVIVKFKSGGTEKFYMSWKQCNDVIEMIWNF